MSVFGRHLRALRLSRLEKDGQFTLRGVARRAGISPALLSRVEAGDDAMSADAIERVAIVLKVNPGVLLAMAGYISKSLQKIITDRPELFYELLNELKDKPDEVVHNTTKKIRDGSW